MREWIWLLVCASAAVAAGTPYDSIVARNAFALCPSSPLQPAPSQAVWTPPPDLKITGLVTVPPTKKVSFHVIEHGKPPRSYVLAEGEQQDDVEVVTIDGDSQTVRVKNQGIYVILDFETHGIKAADAVAPKSGPAH